MSEHTVYHPRLSGVVRTGLSDAMRERHKASGWRMTPLMPEKVGEEPAAPRPSGRKNVIETDSTDSTDD